MKIKRLFYKNSLLPDRGRRFGRPNWYLEPPLHAKDPLAKREIEWPGDLWIEERGVDSNWNDPYRRTDACMPFGGKEYIQLKTQTIIIMIFIY